MSNYIRRPQLSRTRGCAPCVVPEVAHTPGVATEGRWSGMYRICRTYGRMWLALGSYNLSECFRSVDLKRGSLGS